MGKLSGRLLGNVADLNDLRRRVEELETEHAAMERILQGRTDGSDDSEQKIQAAKDLAALRYCFAQGLSIIPRGESADGGSIESRWHVCRPDPERAKPVRAYGGDTLADAVSAYQEAMVAMAEAEQAKRVKARAPGWQALAEAKP